MSNGPIQNTDRELWRERPGDYYADSIHVTANGSIGINCGGHVVVMTARKWHALATNNYRADIQRIVLDVLERVWEVKDKFEMHSVFDAIAAVRKELGL